MNYVLVFIIVMIIIVISYNVGAVSIVSKKNKPYTIGEEVFAYDYNRNTIYKCTITGITTIEGDMITAYKEYSVVSVDRVEGDGHYCKTMNNTSVRRMSRDQNVLKARFSGIEAM